MTKTLILAGGLPGSGKTTFATAIASLNPEETFIVAADDYTDSADFKRSDDPESDEHNLKLVQVAHRRCNDEVYKAMLGEKRVIIVHNTFTRLWERKELRDLAKTFNYQIHDLVMLNTHGSDSIHNVSEQKLRIMRRRMEMPLLPEPQFRKDWTKEPIREILKALSDVPQQKEWHPEGDVATHTTIVFAQVYWKFWEPTKLESATRRIDRTNDLLLAALFHDFGKLDTTRYVHEEQHISAFGHEYHGFKYLEGRKLAIDYNPDNVKWLIENHMRIKFIDTFSEKKQKELTDHPLFPLLEVLSVCDNGGKVSHAKLSIFKGAMEEFLQKIEPNDHISVDV